MITNLVLNILIIILVLVVIGLLLFKNKFKSFFTNLAENFNGSGYGFRKSFSENTMFIPLNEISKSTDFNFLSLINQLKSQTMKDNSNYIITKTEQGIIGKTSEEYPNIIIFPGMGDVKVLNNGNELWPKGNNSKLNELFIKKSKESNNNKKNNSENNYYEFDTNKAGHLSDMYSLLKNLGYKHIDNLTLQLRENQYKYNGRTNEVKVNTINYDFINLDIDLIQKQFDSILENYSKNKNKKTIIIGYDTGCILANHCILGINNNQNLYGIIDKFLMISPNFGGSVISIKDILNAYKSDNIYKLMADGLLLNLPQGKFYDKPVFILNSIGYKSSDISELFKLMNLPKELSDTINNKYKQMSQLHISALKDSGVDTHILFSEEVEIYKNQTPVCYNYKNNLLGNPERYYLPNNNKTGSYQTISNEEGTIEGLTENGDNIIPKTSINILGTIFKNAKVNKIKNQNHFTILKSYEFALNIASLII